MSGSVRSATTEHPSEASGLRTALATVCISGTLEDKLEAAAAAGFDGIYTYDILQYGGGNFARLCKQAHRAHLLCLPSVGPGFDAMRATGDKRIKPRRNGKTYDTMWRAAIKAAPDGVTITSYNEWHEGTQIEPARDTPPRSAARLAVESYDGAYGLHGKSAQRAYLARTLFWVAAFSRAQRPELTS